MGNPGNIFFRHLASGQNNNTFLKPNSLSVRGVGFMQTGQVERACNLWRGFLLSKDRDPDLALIFCKGALLSLNKEAVKT
jgi:hypothetical protein